MEFLHNFGMFIGRLLRISQKQAPRDVSKTDAYLNVIHKILTWEQPNVTSITFMVLLVSLWLILQLEIKFYGVIFMTILMLLLGDYYLENKYLTVDNEEAYALTQQMVNCCNEIIVYLKMIRKKHPMQFCIVMCMLFLWLTVIARNVSGVTLAYLGLIGVFICPVLISRLPPEYIQSLKELLLLFRSQGGLAESELIPYLTVKERDNDLDSMKTDKTMDSITDSLISGITSMPSYMEYEREVNVEEEDLENLFRLTRESSTDTDSDKKSMDFESSHFNGDSSSEDENRYVKDLKFSDVNNDLPTSSKSSEILKHLTGLGGNLISNVFQNKPKRKDSDSDFEIIDSDEVANS